MGFNIFDLLLPREVEFFKYMNKQASIFLDACTAFNKLISGLKDMSASEIKMMVEKIKEYESMGDNIERFVTAQLDKTFITPLDREDIHLIVANIDNSLDFLHMAAQKIDIYNMRKIPPNLVKFSELIVDIAEELRKLILNLKERHDIPLILRNIHTLENEADHLFHITLAELFTKKGDVIEIIKLKDIYQELEDLVNSVDHVAKLIRGIVVKQG